MAESISILSRGIAILGMAECPDFVALDDRAMQVGKNLILEDCGGFSEINQEF